MKKTFYIMAALCISVIHAFFLNAWLSKNDSEVNRITLEKNVSPDSLDVHKLLPVMEEEQMNIAKYIDN
ncbi:hypothetical protein [Pseudopedobacter sp.]|uniref:hypothetical protein n=1 Tax=Pseudopedobacter sp. TaxID=1936787 RepID=UPI0033422B69